MNESNVIYVDFYYKEVIKREIHDFFMLREERIKEETVNESDFSADDIPF